MRTVVNTDDSSGALDEIALEKLLLEFGRRRPFREPLGELIEKEEFTPTQVHVLIWIGHDGPLTMGELARRLCITEKTITGVIDRLEESEHVRRERAEDDRRVVRVHLTRQGSAIFRRVHQLGRKRLAQFLGALDEGDRRDLFRILNKLLSKVNG